MKVKKFQLKNDLSVLLVESHKSPVVSVQMWVHTGSADEQKGEEGISHFIEHLVFKGSEKYDVGEIASTVEGDGGVLNAYTSFDQTVFYVTISKHFAETGLDVVSQMMGFPSFESDEIDREREVVIEEIKRSQDRPERQASAALFSTGYAKHPYGIPVIGYEDNIRKVSRETLLDYYHRRYVPENMTLVVVGDFESKDMKKSVENYFSQLKPFKLKKVKRKKEPKREKTKICVKTGAFEESLLHLSWPIPNAKHKDIPALDILSMILGHGDSSRLMKSLRFKNPLTNYCVASAFTPKDSGLFVISSSLNSENLSPTLDCIKDELIQMIKIGPKEDELRRAITNINSDEYYGLETVDGVAKKVGTYEHLYKDYRVHKQYMKAISALTIEDIKKVAKKYLKPEIMHSIFFTSADGVETKKIIRKWNNKFKTELKNKKLKKVEEPKSKIKKIKWITVSKNKEQPNLLTDTKLKSGTKFISYPNNETAVISMKCALLGGVRVEEDGCLGLNELTNRVWMSESKSLTEEKINTLIDDKASYLSTFGGRNTIGVSLTTLSIFEKDMLELFKEVYMQPRFSSEIVEREKTILLEQIQMREDNPAQLAIAKFMEKMFGGHPYHKDLLGTKESVEAITKEKLEQHLNKMNIAKNMDVVIVGNFDTHLWKNGIEELSSSLGEGNKNNLSFDFVPPSEDVYEFKKLEKEQTHIVYGFPGLTFADEERYTLEVIQSILAGQGGRLFLELRDKASLAYTVSPLKMEGIDAGYFGAYIACSPNKKEKALQMLGEEFSKLAEHKVSDKELERSKKYLIGAHDIDLQKNSAIASSILFDDIYGLPYDETFHYADRINTISSDRVQSLAQKLFSQAKVVSVVGSE